MRWPWVRRSTYRVSLEMQVAALNSAQIWRDYYDDACKTARGLTLALHTLSTTKDLDRAISLIETSKEGTPDIRGIAVFNLRVCRGSVKVNLPPSKGTQNLPETP